MTLEYFYITIQIIFGILSPAFIFLAFKALCDGVNGWAGYWRDSNARYDLLKSSWDFIGSEKCPNANYVSLKFINRKTKDTLSIGCEKVKLP